MLAALVGIVVSLASWCFLELIHQTQTAVFTDLPSDMGYHAPPWWWLLLVLGVAGVIVALAIERLPGGGGHIPAEGLKVGGGLVQPNELPGIVLAGFATIALGLVLGPEAPLLALGGGLGVFAIRTARRDAPLQAQTLLAAAGSFAAMSFIFEQPLIAAVILLEALGLDRRTLPLMLIPGLTAAGVGSLFSGQDQLPGLVSSASTWSISALLLLLGFKGVAWGISLGSFRGGPTFPSLFLGAAGGILASRLPGFDLTAGVVVCMGAAFTAALRLPLSAVVVATLLAGKSGPGTGPLIIVGVVVAYLCTLAMARRQAPAPEDHQSLSPPAAPAA